MVVIVVMVSSMMMLKIGCMSSDGIHKWVERPGEYMIYMGGITRRGVYNTYTQRRARGGGGYLLKSETHPFQT